MTLDELLAEIRDDLRGLSNRVAFLEKKLGVGEGEDSAPDGVSPSRTRKAKAS